MIRTFRRLFRCTRATAAVEAAIFSPIFLTLTLGITDLGSGMFIKTAVNAAAQAGAAYAVINCTAANWSTCQSSVYTAMAYASGNPSFCTGSVCTVTFTGCAEANGGICFTATVNYQFRPILPDAVYAWAQRSMTYSSTATVRVRS
jgi:hypothetical protein